MVNWSPSLGTAVSDLEVEYSEEEGKLYYFKYNLDDGSGEHIPVATTRPETILGDAAVCVHPEDERYKHLVGKEVVVPILGRKVPVIADDYVQMDFGTGAPRNSAQLGAIFGATRRHSAQFSDASPVASSQARSRSRRRTT